MNGSYFVGRDRADTVGTYALVDPDGRVQRTYRGTCESALLGMCEVFGVMGDRFVGPTGQTFMTFTWKGWVPSE